MAQEPITTTGPTITVSTLEELQDTYDLLSHQSGGGTILLEPGDYGTWWQYAYGEPDGPEPVIIKSADPEKPAEFGHIFLRQMENIRIENVVIDGTEDGVGVTGNDLYIYSSNNIQVVNSVLTFDADNALKDAGVILQDGAVLVRDSDGILFENNYIDGHLHGISVIQTKNADIIGNEVTNVMGDGFRGGGLQNVSISDNYMHTFYGIDQNLAHSDMIQIWGAYSYLLTENLTISGNTLIADNDASQSIFIRNEEFGKEGDSTAGYYQNITITDNLIYNGHIAGISVSDTEGLVVDHNTLLWNQDATLAKAGEEGVNYEPFIVLRNTLDGTVTNNIVGDINVPDGTTVSGNQYVSYEHPSDPMYAGSHFVNPFAGAEATYEDVYMLSSSPWYGVYGSSIGNSPEDIGDGVRAVLTAKPADDDWYEVTFDASLSETADGAISEAAGYTFHWTFADGTTAEGISVTKTYDSGGFKSVDLEVRLGGEVEASITRNIAVQTKDIFAFDFEGGVTDISDGVSEIIEKGQTVASDDGTGYLIGDGNKLELGRSTANMYEMESFGLTLDIEPVGDEKTGIFLNLYKVMTGKITSDGHVSFSLTTDTGTYSLTSRDPVFDDGASHRIGLAFDGETGQLEIFADGESVSSTEAWGTTPPAAYWNLVFGNTFDDSIDAIIDNVELSADPAVAGALPVVTPPAPQDDPETPPVNEDPVVQDPPVAQDPPVVQGPTEEQDPPVVQDDPIVPTENEAPEQPEDTSNDPEDGGERGAPLEPVPAKGKDNLLAKFIDLLKGIFGMGDSDQGRPMLADKADPLTESANLSDLVPFVGTPDELVQCDCDDEEDETEIEIAA